MKRLTTVPISTENPVRIRTGDIPAHVAENLAQAVFEAIHREYNRPEIQADFQKWKEERRKRVTA